MPTKRWIALWVGVQIGLMGGEGVALDSLEGLCESGLLHNPKISAIRHRAVASKYYYDQSIDRYKPTVSIDGAYGYDRYDYDYPTETRTYKDTITQYSVTVTQPLYQPVTLNRISDAKLRKKLAKIQVADEEAKLVLQILQTALELIRLHQIENLNLKKVEIFERAYRTIEAKYKLHFSSNPELLQAKQKLAQARSDLAQTRQLFKSKVHNLKLLVNSPRLPGTLYAQTFRILPNYALFAGEKLEAFRKAIGSNTQMKLYQTYLDIAENEIDTRKYERYPTLDARLSYSDSDTTDSIQRTNESRAMLYLSFPVYQGGYVSDRVSEGIELKKAALADLENVRLTSEIAVEKDWSDIQNGIETLKAKIAAQKAAQAYFKTAVEAYKNGLGSLTDAYLAEADMHDAAIATVNGKAQVLNALIDLYYYIGRLNLKSVRRFEQTFFTKNGR